MKRDHITSHIRVHVPLKPHKCDFCGKAFKRPQDLKKHVKTHADDSVLNTPSQNANRGGMGAGSMGPQDVKSEYPEAYPIADALRAYISDSAASGYYPASHDTSMTNPYPAYQNPMGNGQNGGGYPQPPSNSQYNGYGSVSYPNNASTQDLQSLDTRRRAIEALNDFLGDIKRRAIDPGSYYDVGQRLQSTALPLPVSSGYNTGYNNAGGYNSNTSTAAALLDSFNNGGSMGGGGGGVQGSLTSNGYSLPVPNARTKDDLQDIDRFLEQLQQTVYETSNSVAAAGIQQPGVHAMHTGDYGFGNHQAQYRPSNSPTNYGGNGDMMGGVSSMSSMSNNMQGMTSTAIDTPALTPASMSSYASSGHSPTGSDGRSSHASNAMYPSLPSVTGVSDLGAGYPTTTSAPASSLASGFEALDGRRYSGGRLQRQAPGHDTEMADADDGTRTPKPSDAKRARTKGLNSIDPALRGEDEKSPSDSSSTPAGNGSEGADDKRQEEWVENIRVIETLKKWVSDRLKNGEYENDVGSDDAKQGADNKSVEIAKMVAEKLAHTDSEVKYPSLPST